MKLVRLLPKFAQSRSQKCLNLFSGNFNPNKITYGIEYSKKIHKTRRSSPEGYKKQYRKVIENLAPCVRCKTAAEAIKFVSTAWRHSIVHYWHKLLTRRAHGKDFSFIYRTLCSDLWLSDRVFCLRANTAVFTDILLLIHRGRGFVNVTQRRTQHAHRWPQPNV